MLDRVNNSWVLPCNLVQGPDELRVNPQPSGWDGTGPPSHLACFLILIGQDHCYPAKQRKAGRGGAEEIGHIKWREKEGWIEGSNKDG
jgi:hypothetical protein